MNKYFLKSDLNKILYEIVDETNNEVLIKGYTHRIICRTTKDNLVLANDELLEKEERICQKYFLVNQKSRANKVLYGTVLHIDGDKDYLSSCLKFYKELNIHAWGIYIKENEIKQKILSIIDEVKPDIVVITGHDAYNGKGKKDLNNYENSKIYMDVAKTIRNKHSKDDLVIIIGACGSNYEALIASGANFASSPGRINIHTYDPAVVASKVSTTSCNKTVDYDNVIKHMIDGKNAFGGIETKGKMKMIY